MVCPLALPSLFLCLGTGFPCMALASFPFLSFPSHFSFFSPHVFLLCVNQKPQLLLSELGFHSHRIRCRIAPGLPCLIFFYTGKKLKPARNFPLVQKSLKRRWKCHPVTNEEINCRKWLEAGSVVCSAAAMVIFSPPGVVSTHRNMQVWYGIKLPLRHGGRVVVWEQRVEEHWHIP